MDAPRPRRSQGRRPPPVWLAICGCWLVGVSSAADVPAQRVDLIRDLPTAGDLAAPANGQTLYVLEESSGRVIAIDPFEPTKRWVAVAAPEGEGAASPRAICSIDTGTLAVLCRGTTGWSIRSYRVQPGVTAGPDDAVQTVTVAAAAAAPGDTSAAGVNRSRAGIAVSPSRDWLAVAGIDPPAAAVLRAPIAGARIGAISTRSCPQLAAGVRPLAITISADDDFVLCATEQAAGDDATAFVSFFHPPHPRRLLHVDTGVPRIHDAAYCRADGTLWVVGGDPGSATSPEGLWRIDAVLRHGRQEARPTCVARLDGAISLACLSKGAIIVTHGRPSRLVSRIDPSRDAAGNDDGRGTDIPAGSTP